MSVRFRFAVAALALTAACADAPTSTSRVQLSRPSFVLTAGSWAASSGGATYQTAVQQPINDDGSSSFKSTKNGVIPVKFGLSAGTAALAFESICSDNTVPASCAPSQPNDVSFLSFTPSAPTTFAQITNLAANYTFTLGDCHTGSLRWQVRLSPSEAIFIYYGTPPEFGNGGVNGCAPSLQTGTNMINMADLRYDTSQLIGGTFYDSYAHALTLAGERTILRASLILESGYVEDQRLTLVSATVNDNTFIPAPASAPAPTCNLPTAQIQITKTAGASSGPVNEPTSTQPADDNSIFRQVDCKYLYNLSMSSLSGPGTYKVEAIVNGTAATSPATFVLR